MTDQRDSSPRPVDQLFGLKPGTEMHKSTAQLAATSLRAIGPEAARKVVGQWLVEQGANEIGPAVQTLVGILEEVHNAG
jgi:hypothetical protein